MTPDKDAGHQHQGQRHRALRTSTTSSSGKYVSQTGMGMGMIGAKRLMDYFRSGNQKGEGHHGYAWAR